MSDDQAVRAAQAAVERAIDASDDYPPNPATLARCAVKAARPIEQADALDRAGKQAAFEGQAQVAAWLHSCAQGIRDGYWAEWLNETDHPDEDDPPSFTDDGHLDALMESPSP